MESAPLINTTPVSGPSNGEVTINADGTFTYRPDADFNGTDSFVYQIRDVEGLTDEATVTIDVRAINDAPIAFGESFTTDEDTVLNGMTSLLVNDTDVESAPLINTTPVSGPSNGQVTINADGTFIYRLSLIHI